MSDDLDKALDKLDQMTEYTDNFKFDITGITRKIRALKNSLPHLTVRVGLQSTGKLNKKKAFFAAQGGLDEKRQPARNPVDAFIESGQAEKTKEKYIKAFQRGLNNYLSDPKNYRPLSMIKAELKKEFPDIAEDFRESFDQIKPPITKKVQYHKDLTPLVETGKLRKSVRAKFIRAKKKK